MADELILKARDECAGADGQGVVLALAAGELNAVDRANEIDGCGIVSLDLTIHVNHAGILLQLSVQTLCHFLRRYCGISLLNSYALVLAQGYHRLHSNSSGINQVLALADLIYSDLRSGNDIQSGLLHSLRIACVQNSVDCLLIEHLNAIHLLDHSHGCLSLSETGKIESILGLIVGLYKCLVELRSLNLYGQLRHALL